MEKLKQKLKELGVDFVEDFNGRFIYLFDYTFGCSDDNQFDVLENQGNVLAKGMSYEDMYKIVEILCKYKEK